MNSLIDKLTIKQWLYILFAVATLLICIIYTRYALRIPPVNLTSTGIPQSSPTTAITSLSSTNDSARNSLLIQTLHTVNQSGVIYKSPNVQVEYVADDKSFQAEILTTQVVAAIQETENWLLGKGLKQKDICSLHLVFYIDPAVKQSLPSGSQPETLLPEGC